MVCYTLTNEQVFGLYQALYELATTKQDLPIRAGYYILKNIEILRPLYSSIVTMRDNIIAKYQENQNEEGFSEEIKELSCLCNEINLHMISLADIGHETLSFEVINNLMIIVAEE